LLCSLGAVVVLLVVPGVATAAEFVVNTPTDGNTAAEPCIGVEECTLREALELANGETGADTITFSDLQAGTELEVDEVPLPDIFEAVTIEGDTAVGATAGTPAIELVPVALLSEFTPGLSIHGGEGTRIEGLAIGGFATGIELPRPTEGPVPSETEICGNYLGVKLDGETANPNKIGIEIGGNPSEQVAGTVIGNGASCAGNVISSNTEYGVSDSGFKTTIAGNLIGIGAEGAMLPNGTPGPESAGVYETASASGTMIGGVDPSGAEENLIWFNSGPGVLVEGSAGEVSIRHNSFLENEGKGIEIVGGTQPAPTITAASSPFPGTLVIEGTVTGEGEEEVELEFFGGTTCAAGDTHTVLGGSQPIGLVAGSNQYSVELFVSVPEDETAISATSSRTTGGTTEFSACADYVHPGPPEPEPPAPPHEETKPPAQGTNPPTNPLTLSLIPSNGEKVVVKPEEGRVLIKLPGTKKFVPLKELKEIPVGAVIDATKGRVKLTSIDPDGTEQTAEFFGGVFRVKQREGAGLVVLELLDTNVCPATASRQGTFAFASAARAPRASGKLWGSGHGSFRTEGNDGSATVRGTIWLVEDRCDGTTFFKTRRGVVSVRDFTAHKTLPLPAGKTYLAGGE
jgi:hypothetical protein